MRALVFMCLLLVSGAAGGCSRSGDLGGFLAQEVAKFIGRPDGADIICIRGMRDMGEMFDEMGKPWRKKIRIW